MFTRNFLRQCFYNQTRNTETRLNRIPKIRENLIRNFTELGDRTESSRTYSLEDIQAFARLSGDFNPVHVDPEFASKTPFKKCIAHGQLLTSFLSGVTSREMPEGSVLLKHWMDYKAPLFVDEVVRGVAEVFKVEGRKIELKATCFNEKNEVLCDGGGLILLPKKKNTN